ncbi:AIPR family protein [Bacillus cereus]|nr:AIPR family protein [Bacillus cereus]MDA2367214.1 AIPR family protein [Bacillus cereus]MDA2372457.1 AIPR family protein [Bacillus cereus]MDA2399648.1 AIPR family protein [Bacillus cereus]MDA2467887.1 AIPR family protein [Bacillus cereus]
MSAIINHEIQKIQDYFKINQQVITKEDAFEFLVLQYFFYKEKEINIINGDYVDYITNGTNDGGIDIVYYNDEDEVLSLIQCKCTSNFSNEEILNEINKMNTTVEAFKNFNTGAYSDKLKRTLQENLDRLPDNGQIEFHVFYLGNFDLRNFERRLRNSSINDLEELINISDLDVIESQISNVNSTMLKVENHKANIDKANNFLEYESAENYGIQVNLSSNSLIQMYNKFKDKGLFDMNIRKFVPNRLVDTGIKKTLDSDRDNFWFYNNGLIIACEYFEVDGNTIKLENFSIVNGGQTTNLLGKYKGSNSQEFFIPCKIVRKKNENSSEEEMSSFFTDIAEKTNSQKPIKASDLKSNTPEMTSLRRLLNGYNIDFQIKRGERARSNMIKIKNEEFGQLILAFIYQKPGTARSNKKSLFENNNTYASVFKKNYVNSQDKIDFIVDLIKFNDRFKRIYEELKKNNTFKNAAIDILKNGNFIMMALMGILYRIQNGDVSDFNEAAHNITLINGSSFEYEKFISNYIEDDLDHKIEELIIELVVLMEEKYSALLDAGQVTSVSNFFKTDKRYYEDILTSIAQKMTRERTKGPILEYSAFLKR